MRIVTSTEHVGVESANIFTILDTIKAAGYDSVDFNINNYCYPGLNYGDTAFFSDDWKEWISAVGKHANDLGLQFVQSHNLIFNYFDGTEESEMLNRMVYRAVEACEMLGIPQTIVHPVTPPGATPADVARCKEMNAEYYDKLIRFAAPRGVKIFTENMMSHRHFDGSFSWTYCDRPSDLMDLMEAVGSSEDFGMCFDTGHTHYMGDDMYDTMLFYGPRIQALHVHDNNGSDDQHLVMYSGTLDWEKFENGLVDIGYNSHFTLESFRTTIRLPMPLKEGMLRQIREMSQYMVDRIEAKRLAKK